MARAVIKEFLSKEGLTLTKQTRNCLNTASRTFPQNQQRVRYLHQQSRTKTKAEKRFLQWCLEETIKMKNQGRYTPRQAAISSEVQPPFIQFADDQRKLLNFSSYDYLGLAVSLFIFLSDMIFFYSQSLFNVC